jgi:hypothetical protein
MAVAAWGNPDSGDRGLTDFRAVMGGGGARSNLYACDINFPLGIIDVAGSTTVDDTRFMVKAAALPASTVGSIEVPYLGMQFKVAGDRTFDPWTITVINDTSFDIRSAFERWANFINVGGARSGLSNPGVGAVGNVYTSTMNVYQLIKTPLDGGGAAVYSINASNRLTATRGYRFYGVWPSNVSAIDLAYDSNDTVEEFTVELQVSWWEAQAFDSASDNPETAGDGGNVFSVN